MTDRLGGDHIPGFRDCHQRRHLIPASRGRPRRRDARVCWQSWKPLSQKGRLPPMTLAGSTQQPACIRDAPPEPPLSRDVLALLGAVVAVVVIALVVASP